ncbi:MAG TPA: TonB-dependent receptor, partial [Longimicrobiales bacterium]|nr:TonB-dependent receptor [Longimicrobiales bacterium]
LRPGRYTLDVSLLGRAHRTHHVDLSPGGTARVEVTLALAPVVLDALNIKLDRTEMVGRQLTRIPGSAHVLGVERLASQKLALDDVHGMLRQVPGVNVSDEEGYGRRPNIGMRGTGVNRSSKVAIMEDGVLAAPAPYAAPAAYLFPVVARMEAIEVRKGSSQVKYGPWTTGGAMNLVSSSIPAALSGTVDVAGGGDATRKLRAKAGGTHGVFGWLFETYQLRTDGFKQLDNGASTGFELSDHLLKLRLGTGPGARVYQDVELKVGRTDEGSNETYLGLSSADFAAAPFRRYAATQRDRLDTEYTQVSLRHFIRPAPGVDVSTVAYHSDFARTWYKLDRVGSTALTGVLSDPIFAGELEILRGGTSADDALTVRANARDYVSRGVQSVLGLQFGVLGGAHTLEVGARYHRDSEDRFQHDDLYRMQDGRMVLTTAGAPGSQDNRIAEAQALALFMEDRIQYGRWIVSPGVRFETIDFTSTVYGKGDGTRAAPVSVLETNVKVWVPGVGVTRLVGAHGAVFGGVHRGFGPPGPGADASARPEASVNYELGGRWEAPSGSVQVAAFYNDYRNILGKATLASGESGTGELFNGGAVRVNGLEVSGEYPLPFGRALGVRLPLRAAYTYTDARFRTSFQSSFGEWGNVTMGDRLPYLPVHQASASIGAEAPRWRAELGMVAAGAMRTQAGSGPIDPATSTDGFTTFNLSGEYAFNAWTRVFASVQNLTDETYITSRRPAGARPGLPRTLMAGMKVTLR